MTDHPIAPDESSDVPRCVATCPSATVVDCGCCVDCEVDRVQTEVGLMCLPRVRELVQISRRRCDGCKWWRETPAHDDGYGQCVAHDQTRAAHESCSRWEASP